MRCLTGVALFLFTLTLSLSANEKETEEFLTLIGVKNQIELYPQLLSMYAQYNPNLAVPLNNETVEAKVGEIVENRISSMEYFAYAVQGFSRRYDEKRIASYREWSRSEVGEKITRMEIEASSLDAALMVLSYSQTLQANPPGEKRIELIERIASITGVTDQAAVIIDSISEGIYAGLKEVVREDLYLVPAGKSGVPQAILDEMTITTFLYTYRDATDEEFALYLEFLEEKDSRWVLDTLEAVYQEMIREVCVQIGREAGLYFETAAGEYLARVDGLSFERYEVDEGVFAVALPKDPERAVQTVPREAGDIEIVFYMCEYQELGLVFSAAFNVYPEAVVQRQTAYELLDNAMANMINQGQVLLSKEKTSATGNPGYDVKISALNGMMFLRNTLYLAGNTLIQLIFFGPAYLAHHQKLDLFFNSFQLIELWESNRPLNEDGFPRSALPRSAARARR